MSTIPHPQPTRNSRPAATPATVAAYLDSSDKHTQADAAHFFGCSERTIRNRLAEYRQQTSAPAEPAQAPAARHARRFHRVPRPHHIYTVPATPTSAVPAVKRFIPIAAHLVAGPHTSWCAWDGELRPVVPGMTALAWNAEQKRLRLAAATRQRQPQKQEVEAAPSVPELPPAEPVLPDVPPITQPLPIIAAQHNAVPTYQPTVKRSYVPRPARTGFDLAQLIDVGMTMIGPVPLIAWLVVGLIVLLLAR